MKARIVVIATQSTSYRVEIPVPEDLGVLDVLKAFEPFTWGNLWLIRVQDIESRQDSLINIEQICSIDLENRLPKRVGP